MSVAPNSSDFVDRILANQDARRRKVAATMAATRSVHVETVADDVLKAEVDHLLDTMVVELDMQPGYEGTKADDRGGHALLVAGHAGAGKSAAVRTALRRPEFSPLGEAPTFLSVVAPSPFTLAATGNAIARELGYVAERPMKESVVWPLVNRLLRAKGIRVVHIDEAQHGDEVKGTTARAVESTLKGLMQQTDWPVWLILSGLPEVLRFFRDDPSMRRRVRVVELHGLTYPGDAQIVRDVVDRIAATVPHVDCSSILQGDLIPRLLHAATNQFGILVEYVQDAIVECVQCDSHRVAVVHFADVYASRTGAVDADNPFIRPVFVEIDAAMALYAEELDQRGKPTGRRVLKARR